MNNNEMQLSLNGNTFESLKEDFDSILASTVGTMEMKCADNATITLKLDIELDKSFGYTKPKFTHNLSSVMQVKQKKSGSLSGEYELVWDEEEKRHVLRKVKGDQLNFYDDVIDVAYHPTEPSMIEAPIENVIPKLFFDYLKKFVGTQARVVKNVENDYTVECVEENENKGVVLISSAEEENENYCSAETLSEHIGHNLYCTGYSEDSDGEITEICIECEDCEEPIFSVEKKRDAAVPSSDSENAEEDSEYMLKDDEENGDSDEDNVYEYVGPDEI